MTHDYSYGFFKLWIFFVCTEKYIKNSIVQIDSHEVTTKTK